MYEKDAVAAYKIMRNISGINNRTYTKEQQLEYEILKAFYDYFTAAKTPPLVLKQLKHVAEQGKKEGNIYAETAALRIIAESYKLIDYEKAFDILHQLNDRISPIDEKAFAYKAECFNQIGQQYYFLSDYTTAIHYLQKSLTIKETAINWGAIWSSYDVLGLCFQKLNRLDSSDYFFRKAMESPYIKTGSIFYTILQGNLAKNYFLRGQYQEALPLAIIDFNKAAEVGDHDLAANAAVLVSKIYIKFNDKKSFGEWLKKAAFYHEKVRLYKNKSERFYERAPEIYSLMSKWHNINGEKTVANNYLDSVMMAKDTLNVKLNTIYLLRATQSEQNKLKEKAQAEEEKFRLTERVKNSQLVILLLVVLFLLIISVLIYRNQQRKRKMEQLENRLKLSVVEDKLSDTEQKFREAQQLLQDFIAKVAEKE
ncbi:MAG: hypothetical protein LBE82_06890, partial [Chitinophagaceae bacterium]|nr:hypothetical protein [Chitinophagaceae bacterium]